MKTLQALAICFILELVLLSPYYIQACVWVPEDGPTVYWPSTQIPVCFIEQSLPETTVDSGVTYSSNLNATRQAIRSAIQDMSNKTRFNFYGFNQCDPNDSRPMIRINIYRGGGTGKTESIGPNSARTRPYNLTLSQIPSPHIESQFNEQTGRTTSFDHLAWSKTATQHEVMHLLGFHHDMPRTNDAKGGGWDHFLSLQGQTRRVDTEYDQASVMNIRGHGAELSPRDISCINELAERTIRHNAIMRNPLASDTPSLNSATTPAEPSQESSSDSLQ